MNKSRSMPVLVKELAMGFCLGAANIIPGVSGGTFLLIFNIYGRVFSILNRINRSCLFRAAGLVGRFLKHPGQKGTIRAVTGFLVENDFLFLFKLLTGAAIAILGLSTLMTHLLTHYFSLTYALFFGLILVSVVIPVKLFRQVRAYLLIFVLLGAGITVMVYLQVNPYDKIKHKSALYQVQYENQITGQGGKTGNETKLPGLPAPGAQYLYAALCGAVSISAMVLPGISGSLVLILMGAYYDVLSAISALPYFDMDAVVYLGCFSLGIVLGGLVFARLVNYVFQRYYDPTMAVLLGLMVGSLWALWPFKQVAVLDRHFVKENGGVVMLENVRVYTNVNVLPPVDVQLLWAFALFVLGCGIMYGFLRSRDPAPSSSA